MQCPHIVLYALWFLAFGLAMAGRGRAARRVLMACAVTPTALVILAAASPVDRPRLVQLLPFTVFALAAATAWPTTASRRTRVAAAGVVTVIGAACIALVLVEVARLPSDDWSQALLGRGFYTGAAFAAVSAPVVLATFGALVTGLLTVLRRPGILLASLVVGTPWVLLVLAPGLPTAGAQGWWLPWESRPGLGLVVAASAAVLTAAAGSAALRAARAG